MSHIIHRGDCLDPVSGLASLPDRSVDHVITDPPYREGVHIKSVRGKGHRPGGEILDLGFDHLAPETLEAAAAQFARAVRRWVLVFCDAESPHLWREALGDHGLEPVRTGAWIKLHPTPQMTGDRPAAGHEAIVIGHPRGKKRWNGGGKPAIWTAPTAYRAGDPMHHTTQKPLALMEALFRDFTDPGEVVLDPFAGSGTTGVAAKRLGRSFIGWERDPKYHAIAERRIRDAKEQLEIGMRPEKPKQEVML